MVSFDGIQSSSQASGGYHQLKVSELQDPDDSRAPFAMTSSVRLRIRHALQESTYDAVVLGTSLLHHRILDADDLLDENAESAKSWDNCVQCIFLWLLHLAAVGAQLMLTLLLYISTVNCEESPYMDGMTKIAEMRHAVATDSILDKMSETVRLCRTDHVYPHVHTMVVFVWCSRMLEEIKDTLAFMFAIASVDRDQDTSKADTRIDTQIFSRTSSPSEYKAGSGHFEDCEHFKEGTYNIVSLSLTMKAVFITFVCDARFVVGVFLTFASAKYLILEGDMTKLILKAVSMQFVVTLDEVIFKAFVPTTFKGKVKAAEIAFRGFRPRIRVDWAKTFAIIVTSVAFTFLMSYEVMADVRNYRVACRDYFYKFPSERAMQTDFVDALKDVFKVR